MSEELKELVNLFGESKPTLSLCGKGLEDVLAKEKSIKNIRKAAQETWEKTSRRDRRDLTRWLEKHMLRWGICNGPSTTDEWDPEERFLTDHLTRDFLVTVARASKFMGSSYEDNSVYDLEPEVTDMLEFLRRAGIEDVSAIESNDTGLADELFGMDIAYSSYYDPIWEFYVIVGVRKKLLKLAEMHIFRRRELYELFEDEVLTLAGLFFTTFRGDSS